ncbi:MAG: hypothetical protein WAV20_08635 [Blastocatellia bacterium]
MRSKVLIAGAVGLLLMPLAGYGQTSLTGKRAFELYSWKLGGHWYYSLLLRTRATRSYHEITSNRLVRRDIAGLETELRKLSRGEEVFWMGDAPEGATKPPPGNVIDIKHPSRNRIKNVKAICDKLGIKLTLA